MNENTERGAGLSEQQVEELQNIWQTTLLRTLEKYKDQVITTDLAREITQAVNQTFESLEKIEAQLLQKEA